RGEQRRPGPRLAGDLPPESLEAVEAGPRQAGAVGPGQIRHLAQDLLGPVKPPPRVTRAGLTRNDPRIQVQGAPQQAAALLPTARRDVIGLVPGIESGAGEGIYRPQDQATIRPPRQEADSVREWPHRRLAQ